jgi:hypothetical protein
MKYKSVVNQIAIEVEKYNFAKDTIKEMEEETPFEDVMASGYDIIDRKFSAAVVSIIKKMDASGECL